MGEFGPGWIGARPPIFKEFARDLHLDAVALRASELERPRAFELGPDKIGPWSNFEWGMINGKLSAIRSMLGEDWDMLHT